MLVEWDKLNCHNKLDLLRRSMGAFRDALLQPRRLEDEMFQDLRFGVRMLLKHKGFTLMATLTLALGIGANTAIFSVVEAALLRPLPFAGSERVVAIERAYWLFGLGPASGAGSLIRKEPVQTFERVAAYSPGSVNLAEAGEPERVLALAVTADFFPTLGVNPALGRAFSRDEEQAGKNRVAVLSHGLWQRRFGSEPQLIGRSLTLNGHRFTVVGVMPPEFFFPQFPGKTEVLIPLTYLDTALSSEAMDYFELIGRLAPGLQPSQAQAQLEAVRQQLQQAGRIARGHGPVQLKPLTEKFAGSLRPALRVLLGAVGFLLLVACANVANLLLSRAATRQREVAVRSALGASRLRLVRQWLTESLLLALLGGAGGLLLARWSMGALIAISPVYIPRASDIRINAAVLGFTLAVSLLTGLLFGLAPALQFSRPNLNEALKENAHSSSRQRNLVRRSLVAAEVALALVLLVGAGLLLKSFALLRGSDPGFDPARALTFNLWLPRATYTQPAERADFYEQVIERVRAVPGVQAVGGVTNLPLAQEARFFVNFAIEGRPTDQSASGGRRVVTSDYFRAMSIPLLHGRFFTSQDNAQAPPVIIINEALARYHFPHEDPLGKRLKIGAQATYEIVGVVGNVNHFSLEQHAEQEFYLSHAQRPLANLNLVVRTASDPQGLIGAVRQAVWAVDKDQPLYNLRTMEQVLADSLSQRRFSTLLLGLFAAVAVTLGAVGIYGVTSYAVEQRTHEIGIRMALGARSSDVIRLIVGHGSVPALIGAGLGLAAAFGLTRALSSLLFAVSPTDPVIFISVSAFLIIVALLACYLPARKATRVDPMALLRQE
jgi:putative ABC transport system permease protein